MLHHFDAPFPFFRSLENLYSFDCYILEKMRNMYSTYNLVGVGGTVLGQVSDRDAQHRP